MAAFFNANEFLVLTCSLMIEKFLFSFIHGEIRIEYPKKYSALIGICLLLNGAAFAKSSDFDVPALNK